MDQDKCVFNYQLFCIYLHIYLILKNKFKYILKQTLNCVINDSITCRIYLLISLPIFY